MSLGFSCTCIGMKERERERERVMKWDAMVYTHAYRYTYDGLNGQ